MLYNLSIFVYSKNVDAGPSVIAGPVLPTVKDDIVRFGYDAFELNMLAGIFPGHAFEVVYERLFSVSNTRVVLDVLVAGVSRDCILWLTLIEHPVIESGAIAESW